MNPPKFQRETRLSALLIGGSALILLVAIRVEILSCRAGVSLPYTDKGNYNQKWRVAGDRACVNHSKQIVAMLRMQAYVRENPEAPCPTEEEVMAAPLTVEEQRFCYSERQKNLARGSLVNWLSTMGMLQYILAPTVLVLSIYTISFVQRKSVRIIAALTLCVGVACCATMFYRGYFTSLGWYD